jgi:hypothetical protein
MTTKQLIQDQLETLDEEFLKEIYLLLQVFIQFKHQQRKLVLDFPVDEDDEPKEIILESFKQALLEIRRGETIPLAQLWEDIN